MVDRPTGKVAGADLPMKGTKTGFNGDEYGADTSQEACNCMGEIAGATRSDRAGKRFSDDMKKGSD